MTRMTRKLLLLMLMVGAAALLWKEYPAMARYAKMSRM